MKTEEFTPEQAAKLAEFEAAEYPAEVAAHLKHPLGWVAGPCTECGTEETDCTEPDYCCADCLHLADDWEGYERPAADNGDEVERVARAIWDADGGDVRWQAIAPDSWLGAKYRRLAHAALAARRPATEAESGRCPAGHVCIGCIRSVEDPDFDIEAAYRAAADGGGQ